MSSGVAPLIVASLPETSLFDPAALAIVLAGTLIATVARAGLADCTLALAAAGQLLRARFDEVANRSAVARWARAIRQRGLLGAEAPPPPDPTLARAIDALVRSGSLAALEASCDAAAAQRTGRANRAALVFEQAGDLAPVFGLVGTLFAMTQIAPTGAGNAASATFGAIATAVLSSLYGVLSAHLVLLPLAQAIERRSQGEEAAREALVKWLVSELAEALPDGSARHSVAARVARLKPVG